LNCNISANILLDFRSGLGVEGSERPLADLGNVGSEWQQGALFARYCTLHQCPLLRHQPKT
ncbi:MAG: hypothetical protein ACSHWZ_20275, partial [Sulfitobacter sp.]